MTEQVESNTAILVLNTGSSSVKFRLFGTDASLPELSRGQVTDMGSKPVFSVEQHPEAKAQLPTQATHEEALRHIIAWTKHHADYRLHAVGHRVVHGGTEFTRAVRLTPAIRQRLETLVPLAPLHQPHNLAAIDLVAEFAPDLPQVACFDTAFHAGHSALVSQYALPETLTARGIRSYGFHGLSYQWIARRLREDYPQLANGKVVAAHLGSGASMCALAGGVSIDSTMGMTALDGLCMATRCGQIDSGVILYMLRECGLSADETERILYNDSGMKGLSGSSGNMQCLLESTDEKATFAVDYFIFKAAQQLARMAVSLGGLDAVVFTGGIGEHAPAVREAIMRRVAFMGKPPVLVIPANEERVVAMQVVECLKR